MFPACTRGRCVTKIPDIAPDLVPLRRQLMAMVKRPVNLQASRDIVLSFRGDLLGQPYLTLFTKPEGLSLSDRAARHDVPAAHLQHPERRRRPHRAIAKVINACAPDLVLLQEATVPSTSSASRRRPAWPTGAPSRSSRSVS